MKAETTAPTKVGTKVYTTDGPWAESSVVLMGLKKGAMKAEVTAPLKVAMKADMTAGQ